MNPRNNFHSACLVGAVSIAIVSPSSAQQSQAMIEEIIVTANKRQESAMDVGSSITAFSGTALEDRFILSPEDLAQNVPTLELAPSTHGTPVYNMRGVGYNSDAMAVYPAVSISMDQAPMSFPILAARSLYDLERVEVLKGPQGTLFGQNSTGGAINYVAAKPTEDFAASITAGEVDVKHEQAEAQASNPPF